MDRGFGRVMLLAMALLMGRAFGAEGTTVVVPGTGVSPVTPTNTFRPLALELPVDTMILSEDHGYLLLASEAAGKVTAWDIVGGSVVKTIATPAPRAMLCRAGRLYVGNYGRGTIQVFDMATWALKDELLVGSSDVYYLSAPTGKAFHNQIFASSRPEAGLKPTLSVINVALDQPDVRKDSGTIGVSNDGRWMVDVVSPETIWKVADFLATGWRAQPAYRGDFHHQFLHQPANSADWFSRQQVFSPEGQQVKENITRYLLVPDSTKPVTYTLGEKEIEAFLTTPTFPSIGKQAVHYEELPGKKHAGDLWQMVDRRQTPRDPVIDPPVALTQNHVLYVFFHDGSTPVVYAGTFAEFGAPKNVDASAAGNAVASGAGADMPASVPPGKLFTQSLNVPADMALTLMNGPEGMSLSASHVLSWTPRADIAGSSVSIKIRAEKGGEVSFLRYTLSVSGTAPAVVAAADRASRIITIPYDPMSATAGYTVTLSCDGRALLVLAGSTLRITDPSGELAVQTLTLPRHYNNLAERDAYYVAVSNNTLDLLDKKTLAVTKSIALHTSETYDMVIHPSLRLAYVAMHDEHSPADASILSRRVVEVNETTGTASMVEGVYGQWLAMDPQGARLYVGLHDVYQSGYRLDFNYDELVVPDYGTIDVFGAVPLTHGMPMRGKAISDPGVNGQCVRVAPDGKAVSYVSGAGRPVYSYAVPAMDPTNLKETLASYSMKGQGFPMDIAYHPTLPLVAVVGRDHVLVFNRATGDRLEGKLGPIPLRTLYDMKHVYFSPDGKSVVIDPVMDGSGLERGGGRSDQSRRLMAIPLILTDAERAALGRATAPVKPSMPATDAPAPAKRWPGAQQRT